MTELPARPATKPARPFFSSGPCAKPPGWDASKLASESLGRSHRSKIGKARLCALHLEQGSVAPETFERRLGDGLIDFKKLRDAVMEIEWGGWMSIARSRLKGTTSADTNMSANGKSSTIVFPLPLDLIKPLMEALPQRLGGTRPD